MSSFVNYSIGYLKYKWKGSPKLEVHSKEHKLTPHLVPIIFSIVFHILSLPMVLVNYSWDFS